MGTGKAAAILGTILLATACQRQPAAPSVAYQILDESGAGENCPICLSSAPTIACADGGQAAELRWQVPAAAPSLRVRVILERSDGSRTGIADGSASGQSPLPVAVGPGDRIVVQDAVNDRELLFQRVQARLGCALRPNHGAGTTSAGPG
jgi:hypothetical protein